MPKEGGRKEHQAERTRCPGNGPGHKTSRGGETSDMSTGTVPASAAEALGMLRSAMGFLADADAAQMPAAALAQCLRTLEQIDAVGAAARGRFLAAFDAKDGPLADGQRTCRAWLVHCLRVTRGQAGEHLAVQALARQ